MPFDQLTRGEAMPQRVGEILDAGMFLEPAEPAVHRGGRPWITVRVKKCLALFAVANTTPQHSSRARSFTG